MRKLPQISDSEYEVMKVIWKNAPISTTEITERLLKTTSWSPKTIQTLIKRLVSKGVLSYEKQSRVFVYHPLFGEEEYVEQQRKSFLDRFYGGQMSSLICSYLEQDNLPEEELASLRALFEEKLEKGGDGHG